MDRTATFPAWYLRTLDASMAVARRGIFFIVGCQKSGPTGLQSLLNAHPAVCCGGEGHITDLIGPILQQAVKAYNDDHRTSIAFSQEETLSAVRLLADQVFLRYLAP